MSCPALEDENGSCLPKQLVLVPRVCAASRRAVGEEWMPRQVDSTCKHDRVEWADTGNYSEQQCVTMVPKVTKTGQANKYANDRG